jgi:hypothetical protein
MLNHGPLGFESLKAEKLERFELVRVFGGLMPLG